MGLGLAHLRLTQKTRCDVGSGNVFFRKNEKNRGPEGLTAWALPLQCREKREKTKIVRGQNVSMGSDVFLSVRCRDSTEKGYLMEV